MSNTHPTSPRIDGRRIVIENAVVEQRNGHRHSRSSTTAAAVNTRAGDGYPLYFEIETAWGRKKFRMGNRDASPLDQWPDPDVYIHYPDRQLLSFLDVRNTNRTWPGRPDGPLMERVTYGAMQIMRTDKVDLAVDIHGGGDHVSRDQLHRGSGQIHRLATLVS